MRERQGELDLVGSNIGVATALHSRAGDGGGPEGGSGEACGTHNCEGCKGKSFFNPNAVDLR